MKESLRILHLEDGEAPNILGASHLGRKLPRPANKLLVLDFEQC